MKLHKHDNKIRVVLVDDHPMVLKGIQTCLEDYEDISVLKAVSSAEELLACWNEIECDVVLMDMNLPGLNGFEATERLHLINPSTKILVFSMSENGEYARLAVQAGARGYVLKDAMPDELVLAIRTVKTGGSYFSHQMAQAILDTKISNPQNDLTERELDILKKMADGIPSKNIAGELDVSIRTVETHRRNIKMKLGGKSAAECVQIAIKSGLL